MSEYNPIVIIDDEKEMLRAYEMLLKQNKISNYVLYDSSAKFLKDLRSFEPSLVFLDISMPEYSGEEVLDEIRMVHPNSAVLIVSAIQDIETAVRCIQNGAIDYIVKPFDKDRLLTNIAKGREIFSVKKELNTTRQELSKMQLRKNPISSKIITKCPVMHDILQYVYAVAESDSPVLIIGETGTGKDLIAETLHNFSNSGGAFIPVNVSALDENMFNDTLFGHVKGAFTGADKERTGLLGNAGKGTIFLDEIGDLTESSQIKLLRVLQNREYIPIGSDIPLKTEARVLAATNANLRKKVETGEFRQDLYYRLSAHVVELPPLRDRKCDIELLFNHFYYALLEKNNILPREIPCDLINSLRHHRFPGNVREMQSLVQDYVFMFRNKEADKHSLNRFMMKHNIMPVADKTEFDNTLQYSGTFPTLKEMEEILVKSAIAKTRGNQSKAAVLLGITRQALNNRLSKRRR